LSGIADKHPLGLPMSRWHGYYDSIQQAEPFGESREFGPSISDHSCPNYDLKTDAKKG
jgi:hypothetical protein